jgi:uncharacterized protein YjbI with pentapeptide repeats
VSDWEHVADLPFAGALEPHDGGLRRGQDYDGAHFDQLTFDEPEAPGTTFIECALTGVTIQGGRLQRARLHDVLLREVRLVGTALGESGWQDVAVADSLLAGAEVFGARLRRVTFTRCKLDSVNFRGAALTDVAFRDCELTDADFATATLTRVSFPGSRLKQADFSKVTMDATDLRGAELGLIIDAGSLRGATVSTGQLAHIAATLAEVMGITVSDD